MSRNPKQSAMAKNAPAPSKPNVRSDLGLAPDVSLKLLQELHILTRDGRINQDSRRKLKQVRHLVQFITPLLDTALAQGRSPTLVDHGAGKSYLGFMLWDAWFKAHGGSVLGIEIRDELVDRSAALAAEFGFDGMRFLRLDTAQAAASAQLPAQIDVVTALHACDTATDDAIAFGLNRRATHMVIVPCCQAQVAASLRGQRSVFKPTSALSELWRHPLHTREFGSQITNVLRCLQLEAHGYSVTVTELVGWEHSMKNELIVASMVAPASASGTNSARRASSQMAAARLSGVLAEIGLPELQSRFFVPG